MWQWINLASHTTIWHWQVITQVLPHFNGIMNPIHLFHDVRAWHKKIKSKKEINQLQSTEKIDSWSIRTHGATSRYTLIYLLHVSVMIDLALWHKSFEFTGFSYFLAWYKARAILPYLGVKGIYIDTRVVHNRESKPQSQCIRINSSTTCHGSTLLRPITKLLEKLDDSWNLPVTYQNTIFCKNVCTS